MNTNVSLWKDDVNVEVNKAVLQSYEVSEWVSKWVSHYHHITLRLTLQTTLNPRPQTGCRRDTRGPPYGCWVLHSVHVQRAKRSRWMPCRLGVDSASHIWLHHPRIPPRDVALLPQTCLWVSGACLGRLRPLQPRRAHIVSLTTLQKGCIVRYLLDYYYYYSTLTFLVCSLYDSILIHLFCSFLCLSSIVSGSFNLFHSLFYYTGVPFPAKRSANHL